MNKEFSEKIKNSNTVEEVRELTDKEHGELTDEELKEVAGGCEGKPSGSQNVVRRK